MGLESWKYDRFQSRNRESFLFKEDFVFTPDAPTGLFQSRNRESFLFKLNIRQTFRCAPTKFQSRNRESFLFKKFNSFLMPTEVFRFNLVIENLFFSSRLQPQRKLSNRPRFNLVIENLFFSRLWTATLYRSKHSQFQSRNRESFLFKVSPMFKLAGISEIRVSIS